VQERPSARGGAPAAPAAAAGPESGLRRSRSASPSRSLVRLRRAPQGAQCVAVATGPELPAWATELSGQIEAAKFTSNARCSAAVARRDRCAEELRRREKASQDEAAAAERFEAELLLAEDAARAVEEKLSWLDDIAAHCEKAKAKQLFDGPVMEAFNASVAHMRRAGDLQQERVRDAQASQKRKRDERDGRRKELEGKEQQVAAAMKSLAQADEEVKAAQFQFEQLEGQGAKLRSSVTRACADVDAAERGLREASRLRGQLRAQDAEYAAWTEDLYSFFEGRGVRDSGAIFRGLQAMLPPGDPMPVIVRAMLTDSSGTVDKGNLTTMSMRELVAGQIRTCMAGLKEKLSSQEVAHTESEQRRVEARMQMRKCEEQWRSAVSSAAMPAKPTTVARPLRRSY